LEGKRRRFKRRERVRRQRGWRQKGSFGLFGAVLAGREGGLGVSRTGFLIRDGGLGGIGKQWEEG
jgi:hypothetical protein